MGWVGGRSRGLFDTLDCDLDSMVYSVVYLTLLRFCRSRSGMAHKMHVDWTSQAGK